MKVTDQDRQTYL